MAVGVEFSSTLSLFLFLLTIVGGVAVAGEVGRGGDGHNLMMGRRGFRGVAG